MGTCTKSNEAPLIHLHHGESEESCGVRRYERQKEW